MTNENAERTGLPENKGWLALVATPIGNLSDLTYRAAEVLRAADLIACEDTRRARILCSHCGARARLTAYHAHNEHRKTAALLAAVAAGKGVAVLSDAGTPAVSDPGYLVMRTALAQGIEPIVVPGVSALTFAVVAGGLPVDRFRFLGFLPVKRGKRRRTLAALLDSETTVFVFESPHRVERLLGELQEVFGAHLPVAVVREATKLHEETLRGTVADLIAQTTGRKWRGELVVGFNTRTPKRGHENT